MADGEPLPAIPEVGLPGMVPKPPVKQPERPRLRDVLGPGLVTGASDDDPSGIATYSQAGAQFGFGLTWTLLFTYPLMAAIQLICAQIS
jgi:Mn2+/Fe2+ NRAMP family transporter